MSDNELIALLRDYVPASDDEWVPETPNCIFETAKLTNKTQHTIAGWSYGVLFRAAGTQPLVRQMGAVSPGSTSTDNPHFSGCAYRKLSRVVLNDGRVYTSPVRQLADKQCYTVAGWDFAILPGTEQLALIWR